MLDLKYWSSYFLDDSSDKMVRNYKSSQEYDFIINEINLSGGNRNVSITMNFKNINM